MDGQELYSGYRVGPTLGPKRTSIVVQFFECFDDMYNGTEGVLLNK